MFIAFALPLLAGYLADAYPVEATWSPTGWADKIHVAAGQSIQAAIDKAAPYSIIEVAAGTYHEQLSISKNGIALQSPAGAIIEPPPSFITNTCTGLAGPGSQAGICITGQNVVLKDFVSEHRRFVSVGRRIEKVVVTGMTTRGFNGMGVAVVGADTTTVDDCAFLEGPLYGFLSVGSKHTTVSQSSVVGVVGLGFIGICTDDLENSNVFNSRYVKGYKVGLCLQTPDASYMGNDVSDVCVGTFVDPGVTGALVEDNTYGTTAEECVGSPVVGGIILYGAMDTTVKNNTISGQRAGGKAGGIILIDANEVSPPVIASGNSITANKLTNNDFDIYINSTGTGNVATSNQCATCT